MINVIFIFFTIQKFPIHSLQKKRFKLSFIQNKAQNYKRLIRFDHLNTKINDKKVQKEQKYITMIDPQHLCQICSMQYSSTQKYCPFCDSPSLLFKPKKNVSTISCHKCNFENDLANTNCVACDSDLYEKQEEKVQCKHCGLLVLKRLIDSHSQNCMLSMLVIEEHKREEQALKQLQLYKETEIKCKYCSLLIPQDLLDDHNEVCEKKPKPLSKPLPIIKPLPIHKPKPKPMPYGIGYGLKPIVAAPAEDIEPYEDIQFDKRIKQQQLFEAAEIARLSSLQKTAIMYMQQRSLREHEKVQKQLQQRTRKLGYKKQDLQNLIFYIENYAPIIIHIHITKHMEFFVKDTHYRNQFETGKSSGSLSRQSRTQWENRMFDKKYAKATDHERVKYGVINFTNDPKGVNCALGYGMSYFLLKQHVRNRCTMTDMDSSSATSVIGTFKYCFHILNKMNDQQLKSAFNAAKALQESSTVTTTYKQIQIHGPIEFAKDIQRVYVNKKEVQDKKFLDMVYKFCETNKIDYEFI